MHPLAHHLGEDSLLNFLLVGGTGLSIMVVEGRARLVAARARLIRKQGSRRRPDCAADPVRDGPPGRTA